MVAVAFFGKVMHGLLNEVHYVGGCSSLHILRLSLLLESLEKVLNGDCVLVLSEIILPAAAAAGFVSVTSHTEAQSVPPVVVIHTKSVTIVPAAR